MKKSIIIFAAALITASALSGCSNGTEASQSGLQGENSYTNAPVSSTEASSSTPNTDKTTGQNSSETPEQSNTPGDTTSVISDSREQIVTMTQALTGIDFVLGKASPEEGFDNSGLIYYVLRENGYINCPRGTSAQMEMGTKVGFDDIQPGDLVFFSDVDEESGESYDFGGIYVGGGKLVYSPYPGEKVKYADINSQYWKNSFNCAVSVS